MILLTTCEITYRMKFKEKLMKKIKSFILLLLSIFILSTQNIKASTTSNFETTSGSYTIENILSKFNVFSFNHVTGVHIVGPIIAKGDLYNRTNDQGFTFGDYDQGVSSYIQGKIATGSRTSSSYSHINPDQYIGNTNTLFKKVYWGDDFVYQVNGSDYVNNKVNVYQTDHYVDWNKAKSMLVNQSIQLSQLPARLLTNADIITTPGIVSVQIHAGERVTIPESILNQINRIQFIGSYEKQTVINILSENDVILPGVITSSSYGEYGSNMNIVFNIPYSTQVTLPNAYGNGIGHIVALNANVIHRSGNYNGGIIAANLDSYSEGHMWNYSGGPLVPETPVETTQISGTKFWNDQNDLYGLRPQSIQINLYANDEFIDSQIINESGNWKYIFNNLPILENGSYSIRETETENYNASYEDYDITNTLQTGDIQVNKKIFINQEQTVSEEIFHVALYSNDQMIAVKAIQANESITFDNLPLGTYHLYETDSSGNMLIDSLYQSTFTSSIIDLDENHQIATSTLINSINTHVQIYKKDIDGNNLSNAHLQLLDENQNVVAEWISTDTAHDLIASLLPGKKYTLREAKSPSGYQKADDLSFIVQFSNQIQNIYLINELEEIIDPEIPTDPEKPTTPEIPNETGKPNTPKTGDSSLMIYGSLFLISGLCILLSIKMKRKS